MVRIKWDIPPLYSFPAVVYGIAKPRASQPGGQQEPPCCQQGIERTMTPCFPEDASIWARKEGEASQIFRDGSLGLSP